VSHNEVAEKTSTGKGIKTLDMTEWNRTGSINPCLIEDCETGPR